MKKRQGFLKILICCAICFATFLSVALVSFASEGAESREADAAVAEEENIFDEIYSALCENSADILSLLSFAASITVAFLYKYALSPLLKGGLEKIASGVKTVSGESAKEYESISMTQASLAKKSEEIENELKRLSAGVTALRMEKDEALQKSLLTVMGAQVNMLNEIFQASALPVYQKEAVGNMINEMKSELMKNERTTEEA
jgi:hypothetical protein